jgi:hypothetical protein
MILFRFSNTNGLHAFTHHGELQHILPQITFVFQICISNFPLTISFAFHVQLLLIAARFQALIFEFFKYLLHHQFQHIENFTSLMILYSLSLLFQIKDH